MQSTMARLYSKPPCREGIRFSTGDKSLAGKRQNVTQARPTYIISEHVGQEVHHDAVLPRILLTKSADGLHHHHLRATDKDTFGSTGEREGNAARTKGNMPGDGLTLNSSEISDTNEEICFMSRSTLLSLPVLSRVVMASVAMLRFESVMRFSRSKLHAVTADGCFMATWWMPLILHYCSFQLACTSL